MMQWACAMKEWKSKGGVAYCMRHMKRDGTTEEVNGTEMSETLALKTLWSLIDTYNAVHVMDAYIADMDGNVIAHVSPISRKVKRKTNGRD